MKKKKLYTWSELNLHDATLEQKLEDQRKKK
jgi:hypothetical protein